MRGGVNKPRLLWETRLREDPHTLDVIKDGLRELGYPRNQDLDISITEHETKDI